MRHTAQCDAMQNMQQILYKVYSVAGITALCRITENSYKLVTIPATLRITLVLVLPAWHQSEYKYLQSIIRTPSEHRITDEPEDGQDDGENISSVEPCITTVQVGQTWSS